MTSPNALIIPAVSVTAAVNLFTIDCTNFQNVTVQVTSPGTTCTITYEQSLDNANWTACVGYICTNNGSAVPASTSTTAVMTTFQVLATYFRARVSAYTSGTVTAQAIAKQVPAGLVGVGVNNTVAANSTGQATTNLIGDVSMGVRTTATNAATQSKFISAASNNAASLKASAGRVYGWFLTNTTASAKFFKVYNKATSPTVGTDVPVMTVGISPNSTSFFMRDFGVSFATGIAIACTGAAADADNTSTAANDVVGGLLYA